MKNFRTLLCAALLALPGSLFASAPVTPFVEANQTNAFAAWTPNQLAKTQSTVDLSIQLPYRGQHNNWTITFRSYDNTYSFTTNSSSNPDNNLYPLGSIESGTYDVDFYNTDSHDAQFEFWVGCNNAWVQGNGWQHEKTVYNVSIATGCETIYIDANY